MSEFIMNWSVLFGKVVASVHKIIKLGNGL